MIKISNLQDFSTHIPFCNLFLCLYCSQLSVFTLSLSSVSSGFWPVCWDPVSCSWCRHSCWCHQSAFGPQRRSKKPEPDWTEEGKTRKHKYNKLSGNYLDHENVRLMSIIILCNNLFCHCMTLYLRVNDAFCEPGLQNFSLVVHLPDTWESQPGEKKHLKKLYFNCIQWTSVKLSNI